jgi:hypothetical protein
MWVSRRDVGWSLAAIPVALVLGVIAFATPWPVLVFVVGAVVWIVIVSILYHGRQGAQRQKGGKPE